MPTSKANKKLLKKVYEDEERYLKEMKGQKIKPCDEPLYKSVARSGLHKKKGKQSGGFAWLVNLITTLGPPLLNYAINKFTGSGIKYMRKEGGRYHDLNESEKKHLLYNMLTEYPHLIDEVFK